LKTKEKRRILVTGSSGLLGSKIIEQARRLYEVISTYRTKPSFPNSVKMDITQESDVQQVFSHLKPSIVIHTAAETNVDKCEVSNEHAWRVNAKGTKNIADMSRMVSAEIIYVSTDYVFDGEKGRYTEDDDPNPINYYGLTKREGEKYIVETCKDYVIVRTSVLYGWHPSKSNFVKWVITSLEENRRINVVNDHYNSPTFADNLAEAVLEIIEKDLKGLYHTAGSQRIDRYEFAVEVARTFLLDSSLIQPVKMNDLKAWVAKRPKDSSLCIDKIQKSIRTKLLNVNDALGRMKERATE
jgi:dTDP-4-dehydrorhamnose reductase